MADASLVWGGDLAVGATGDLWLAGESTLGEQRVLRRLMTNRGDYIWQPGYGAGLGQFVGSTASPHAIRAVILNQLLQERAVAAAPAPVIDIEVPGDGSIYVHLRYADAATGSTQVLAFSVSA